MDKQDKRIQKPMIIAYKECLDGILNLINTSGVPPFVLEMMFNELLNNIRESVRIEYQNANDIYKKNLKKEENFIVGEPDTLKVNEEK